MVDILRELLKYVPVKIYGDPITTILWGDGLSCERVKDAQESCVNNNTKTGRLLGFEPSPQEWHKRLQYVTVRFFCFHL